MTRRAPVVWVLLPFLCLAAASFASKAGSAGLVVEQAGQSSAAQAAGIQAGDLLVSWESGRERRALSSPFDLLDVEMEQAPRRPVKLHGLRNGTAFGVTITGVDWKLDIRPAFDEEIDSLYSEGRQSFESGQADQGYGLWKRVARTSKDRRVECWLHYRAAGLFADARQWKEAEEAYLASQDCASRHGEARILAMVLEARGKAFLRQSRFAESQTAHGQALAIREKAGTDSLALANSYHGLGVALRFQGNMDTAEQSYRKALAIRQKLAPGSLDESKSLGELGNVSFNRGDLSAAQELYQRALAIQEKLAPDSLITAGSLGNLGNVADEQGDLLAAQEFYNRSLAIKGKIDPTGYPYAVDLNNLAIVHLERGALSEAEEIFRSAAEIYRRVRPDGLELADVFSNLGIVLQFRMDLDGAEEYYRQALTIREKLAPDSMKVAISLTNLGSLAEARSDLRAAREYHDRSFSIRQRLAPDSLHLADSLSSLGNLALREKAFSSAEEYFGKALTLCEKHSPTGSRMGKILRNLGDLARERGDLAASERLYQRCIDIWEQVAPGSTDQAVGYHSLGWVMWKTGRLHEAADRFRQAIQALEEQKGKLGGTEEVRTGFAATYSDFYRDYIQVLLELGRRDEAFHFLERSRARSLLAMLTERDLVFRDVPEDLERERKRIAAQYDRVQGRLAELDPAGQREDADKLRARLLELSREREKVIEKIRMTSPHFASLNYPQPLDLPGVRGVLDPGTVLLSYLVCKDRSLLFVVSDRLSVFELPLGAEALRAKVETFRRLIRRRAPLSSGSPLFGQATELYALLVQPAEGLLQSCTRVLIIPDGPLHTLPFASLIRTRGAAESGMFLTEWKTVSVAVSATVYAELKKRLPEDWRPTLEMAAFGNPKYPSTALERANALTALPASQNEVEQIAALFGDAAQRFTGSEATEARAREIGKNARYLHFACHGLLDERFPLNSALALAVPEGKRESGENGLLQAWEIFEDVRTHAELVTLSACETGLGKEMGGEGLIGLTRAFHYAGARSVLASLWSVSDESTSELMKRFYSRLKSGKAKDEALRLAQLDLIRKAAGQEYSHPFHWAAFHMMGGPD